MVGRWASRSSDVPAGVEKSQGTVIQGDRRLMMGSKTRRGTSWPDGFARHFPHATSILNFPIPLPCPRSVLMAHHGGQTGAAITGVKRSRYLFQRQKGHLPLTMGSKATPGHPVEQTRTSKASSPPRATCNSPTSLYSQRNALTTSMPSAAEPRWAETKLCHRIHRRLSRAEAASASGQSETHSSPTQPRP